jgi:hypothetical protein
MSAGGAPRGDAYSAVAYTAEVGREERKRWGVCGCGITPEMEGARRSLLIRLRPRMLELRPNCELCDKDLPPEAADARICSYECTFSPPASRKFSATCARIAVAVFRCGRSVQRTHGGKALGCSTTRQAAGDATLPAPLRRSRHSPIRCAWSRLSPAPHSRGNPLDRAVPHVPGRERSGRLVSSGKCGRSSGQMAPRREVGSGQRELPRGPRPKKERVPYRQAVVTGAVGFKVALRAVRGDR